jgi:hypothetical protein
MLLVASAHYVIVKIHSVVIDGVHYVVGFHFVCQQIT